MSFSGLSESSSGRFGRLFVRLAFIMWADGLHLRFPGAGDAGSSSTSSASLPDYRQSCLFSWMFRYG